VSHDNHPNDAELSRLTEALAECLLAAKLRLVTAESCTGGWIAKCCTDLAGSSDWFECGMVSYSNAAKSTLLGVPVDLIDSHGAVSAEVAAAMAIGALHGSEAQIALSVTGIAGPGGGSEEKPVGTVCFGWASYQQGEIVSQTAVEYFGGGRDAVRRQTIQRAINGILSF
jgi:nicotinamide-nucleotide amidase